MKHNFFNKNTSLRITISLLLFIPLVVAIVFALRVDPNTVVVNNLNTVTVSTPQGSSYTFDDEAVLDVYSSIPDNAKEIAKDFRDFSSEEPYTVTFKESNTDPISYTLYTSDNVNDYVYVAPDGKYYLLNSVVAQKLSERQELSYINIDEIVPNAKAGGFGIMSELCASSYDWTYTAKDGSLAELNSSASAENPVIKFAMSENGMLRFEFDKAPDSLNLTIESDSTVFFNDKLENLSGANMISFDHDELLRATAVAEWYEIDGAEYFGSATYNFNLLYDIEPTYRVVDTKPLPTGDFTVLRMSDFNDGEKLTMINNMGLPETVNVYDLEDEDVKIAFIPFGNTLETGDYTITLKTDTGFTKDITVSTVVREEYDKQTLLINEETDKSLSDAFSKASIEEFDALIARLTSESVNKKLYDGKFEYPTGGSQAVEGGSTYGERLEIYSLNSSGDIYISNGIDLVCMDNQELTAANHGIVVYADKTTLFGNTVIIDHGYGILSVYGNMSDIAVRVGDEVQKKDSVLGIAGSTGFACVQNGASATTGTMCHYAVALNGVFVAPKSVYNGIFLKY